ncbi:MAG: molybdate ABC transporter substrate-binding protein [Termitinemataceae bacterium]|nr:MAG: molybdate ABC transporter substrate-binding protein [Termitinemataceae bacterium]
MIKKLPALVLAISIASIITSCTKKSDEKAEILVAAAASLKNAYDNEIIPAFQKKEPNIKIKGTYDSSGKLQTQIEGGLNADVFMSASVKQMNALVEANFINKADVNNLLQNKIVLITGNESKTSVKSFAEIPMARNIAIGDPASVPAGQYAQEALIKLSLWDALPQTSFGTNVTEVLSAVAALSAEIGIVYATDAASNPNVFIIAELPPASLAAPVIYPVASLARSAHKSEAEKFVAFLASDEAIMIFQKYGFSKN